MPGRLELLQERLRRDHISVDDVWLSECIEHFVSVEPAISTPDLYEKTLEQWSLSDLADIGIANLPAQVNDDRTSMLAGKYVLQLLFILDISRSAYDQLRVLNDQQTDQTDGEQLESKALKATKKKRTLKLQLTDGHRSVAAIEMIPIACLSTKLAPGCKLVLSGPLRCVQRVLLLEPQHVRVLGGEVAKYEIENAYDNVLLRQLGRPLNPEPRTEYIEPPVIEVKPRDVQHLDALHEQYRQHKSESQAAADINFSNDMFDDDDMLAQVDLDEAVPAKNTTAHHQNAPLIDLAEEDDEDFGNIPIPTTATRDTETYNLDSDDDADFANVTMGNTRRSVVETATVAALIDDDDDDFARAAFDEELLQKEQIALTPPNNPPTPPSIRDASYPYRFQKCHLVTIEQLLQPFVARPATDADAPAFIVKAEVVSVFEKLLIRPDGWRIGVLLRDTNNSQLRVRLVDEQLDTLSGFTVTELCEMRRQAAVRPQMLEQIAEMLAVLKTKLETMHCYWKLAAKAQADGVWMVTQLVQESSVLKQLLERKLDEERRNV